MAPYRKIWDEAMLTACIEFIGQELGIRTVFYHEYQSGAWLKSIFYDLPPRSLYSELPRRFCFTQTEREPLFLQKDRYYQKRKRKFNQPISWFVMNL